MIRLAGAIRAGEIRAGDIRACGPDDLADILAIINDAAEAYRGVIPADCFHDPYMSAGALRDEIAAGVRFAGWEIEAGDPGSAAGEGRVVRAAARRLVGVMGSQDVLDVTLIRHAYVATAARRGGIGTALLAHLRAATDRPVLIGTWAAADWAVDFYVKHGFRVIVGDEKTRLLHRYWTVPDRQIETSVVLADARWK